MPLIDAILSEAPKLTALRREMHAHPELCFEEHRTADLVARQLEGWGIEVHRGLGKTGVVGVIRGSGGSSPRAIGLRADMDALPITELNRFEHASRHPGKMHACGHDGHTAMLLGAAQYLAAHRDFDGTVVLIFQPAEEGGGGAREMIREGLWERFPVDAVFGMHNWPGLPAGTLAVCEGPTMASSNEFRITVRGQGAHAAMPHLGIDPVPVACQMVQAFQTIVTRNKKPVDAAVISVTMVHAGEATNVVPETCEIQGTVRTFTLEVLDLIEQRMQQVAEHTCAAYGATCDFRFKRNYPPTINHVAEARFVRGVMQTLVGEEATRLFEPTMGAEDFSFMLQDKPGAYFMIGNGAAPSVAAGASSGPGHVAADDAQHGLGGCSLHNPHYDFNDAVLPLGASLWVRLAQRWLGG